MSMSVQASSSTHTTSKQHKSKSISKTNSGRTFTKKKADELSKGLREYERLKKIGIFPTEPIELEESLIKSSCFSTNFIGRIFVVSIPVLVILGIFAESLVVALDSFRDREECSVAKSSAIARVCLCVVFLFTSIAVYRYEKLKEKDDKALDDYREEQYRKFSFSIFLKNFYELKKLVEDTNQQIDQNLAVAQKAQKCLKQLSKCDFDQMRFSPEMWVSLILHLMNKKSQNSELNELVQNALKLGQDSPRKDTVTELLKKKKSKKKFQGESGPEASISAETSDFSNQFQRSDAANLFSQIKKMGCGLNIRALLVNDTNGQRCIGLDGLIYQDMSSALENVPDDSYTIDMSVAKK